MTLTLARRVVAAPATLALAIVVVACSTSGGTPSAAPPESAAPPAAASQSAGTGTACPTSAPGPLAAGETRTVTIETAKGAVDVTVEADLGPLAAGNFVALAECGYYEGVVFHRLVPGFVIQGGDPTGTGTGGPGYQFDNDPVSVAYERGVVAMANAGPNTNGSQFFIVLADSDLPPDYSVFGRVTSGMDVVDAIAAEPNSGGRENRALDPIPMDRVTVANP